MREIKKFIVHCADTPSHMDIGVKEIRKWHTDSKPDGNGWSDIGYHYVIRRNGELEIGRPIERSGAHTRGHNEDSVGICLVGRHYFTSEQFMALQTLYTAFQSLYGNIPCYGHKDFDSGKTCPNFEVREK